MLPLIGLKLLGIGRAVTGWLSRRSLVELACIALALLAAVQTYRVADAKSDAARWEKQFRSEHNIRLSDLKSYRDAQQQAQINNEKQLQTIQSKYEANNAQSQADLNSRIDYLRRELREQANRAAQGSPNGSSTGQTVAAPCRVADPAWMCIPTDQYVLGAEYEERLDQWIKLAKRQNEVRP